MLQYATLVHQPRPRRVVSEHGSSGGGCVGSLGCFALLMVGGVILYLMFRGRGDRQEVLGASKRPMGSGPLQPVSFTCPYPKCPTCGGSADKMKQQWDGMRKVTWTCGYCSAVAGVQELKDEELPASARQRLGLDQAAMPMQGQPGYGPGYGGGGIGNILTGMMIGNMLGGDHHHDRPRDDDWTGGSGGSSDSSSSSGSDWGESSGGSDWGGGDSGGGDSGGGDSGGGSDW